MKYHLTALAIAIATCTFSPEFVSAQANDTQTKHEQAFTNLPLETRQEFATNLQKTQKLFGQKRIFDCLDKIHHLEKIYPNHLTALNIKGACYIEIRDFDKAREAYKKGLEVSGGSNINIMFNLAEVDFVSKNWAASEKQFENIIQAEKQNNKNFTRLCELKALLSKIKLGKITEAKALRDKYDQWDDSPFYYYSRAAILSEEGKRKEAAKMIKQCLSIWNDQKALHPWQDTIQEYGMFAKPDLTNQEEDIIDQPED